MGRLYQWVSHTFFSTANFFSPIQQRLTDDPASHLLNPIDNDSVSIDVESVATVEIEQQKSKLSSPQATSTETISAFQIAKSYKSLIFSRENLPRIINASLLTICSSGLNFLSPYLFGKTIELLSSEDENMEIAGIEVSRSALITMLITAYALSQIVPNMRDQCLIPVTNRNTKKILLQSTEHLLKKSYRYHVDTPLPDDFYLLQKAYTVSVTGTPLLTQVAPTMIEICIACTVISSQYGVEMGLGLFGLLTAYTGYSALTAKPIINARETSLQMGNEAYDKFCNAIAQYKNMRDFVKFDETIKDVEKALDKMMKADITAASKPMQIGYGHVSMSRIHMLLACLYVGLNIKPNKFNVDDFVVIFGYLNQLSTLLPAFGQAINQLFACYPDLKFVFGELAKPDEVVDLYPNIPLPVVPGVPPSIEFDNVTFCYPSKPGEDKKLPLFQNLSFKVMPGQKVALVSASGAGKTTIFNLLYGYYAPDEGAIKVNGQNVSLVSLNSLQRNITLFGQNPNLFKGSIRDNIRYGAKNSDQVTDEMIFDLAKNAGMDGFLESFDKKLDTDVGENGKKLSGGQQQKVAILRGLLKGGSICLMDEITAPFDSESATKVLVNMKSLVNGATTLMITHKLTEAQFVDQILVIDKGKVIAQGTHSELLETCGFYKTLWDAYIKKESHEKQEAKASPSSSMAKIITSLDISAPLFDPNIEHSTKADQNTVKSKGNEDHASQVMNSSDATVTMTQRKYS